MLRRKKHDVLAHFTRRKKKLIRMWNGPAQLDMNKLEDWDQNVDIERVTRPRVLFSNVLLSIVQMKRFIVQMKNFIVFQI